MIPLYIAVNSPNHNIGVSLSDDIVELDMDEHPGVCLLMIRWTKIGQVNMWVTTTVKKANSSILFSEILRKAFQSLGIFPWPVTVYLNKGMTTV